MRALVVSVMGLSEACPQGQHLTYLALGL